MVEKKKLIKRKKEINRVENKINQGQKKKLTG